MVAGVNGRPIFVELADTIADDILAGVYPEDSQVPSTTELAAHYRINPATAGKALNRLVEAEVLLKRRGLGMFVAPGGVDRLHRQRRNAFADTYLRPFLAEGRRLGLTIDDILELIRREHP